MTSVVLGIDPQWTRLGLALVELEPPHRALWADTVSIDEPDGGWKYQQIRRALREIPVAGLWSFGLPEIARIGIEQPSLQYGAFKAGGAFHLVLAECHRRWPHAPQVVRQPSQWKKATVGKGNASKLEVFEWAIEHGGRVIFDPPKCEQQDSADALAVAVAAAKVELQGDDSIREVSTGGEA